MWRSVKCGAVRDLGSMISVALIACVVAGCVVNPVTGQREIALVSTAQELAIGREQYGPAQQLQGGAYRTDAALTAYVASVGQRVARSSGRDLPYEFVVLNSSVPNAWALPGGKIAVNRGLLVELRNEAELAAVLGHEIAHAAARHSAKSIERGMLVQGALVVASVGLSHSEYAAEVVGGAQLAGELLNQKFSRDAEREADFYGTEFMMKAGYDPYAAVTLQETFVRLSQEGDADWLQGLFASHPASAERVSNNRSLVARLKRDGFVGEFKQAEFAQAMTKVVQAQDAYDEYDGAVVFYEEGEWDVALNQVNAALQVEPDEALFHGLRGAIALRQKRYTDAVTDLDRAIARDPGYFVYYLDRGIAHSRNGDKAHAKTDLAQSVSLLPTAGGYQALGELAESDGDQDAAIRYYAAAAQAPGTTGQTALADMLRLELPRNPAKYIRTETTLDSDGSLILQVSNLAKLAVGAVQVRVELQTGNDTQSVTETVPRLGPGESQAVRMADAGAFERARAYPLSATLVR